MKPSTLILDGVLAALVAGYVLIKIRKRVDKNANVLRIGCYIILAASALGIVQGLRII